MTQRILGWKNLLHDAVDKTTDLVQATHNASAARFARMLSVVPVVNEVTQAVVATQRLVGTVVYEAIRAANHGVRALGDAGVPVAAAALPDAVAPRWVDRVESALNGFYGDFLEARGSGLAIPMTLRHEGRELQPGRATLVEAYPAATGKLCLFVHGLACSEAEWTARGGFSFGAALARDLGYTPLYLRYNTGLHISANARELAELLGALVDAWPVPVEQLALVGHSMGGLVARGAAHYGSAAAAPWVSRLRHVVCIGSPHLGAPLAQHTHTAATVLRRLGTAATDVFAGLLDMRSAGIRDLRHGHVLDEDWMNDRRNEVPFVPTASYAFVAAAITRDPEHPLGKLVGDLLVQVPSASGAEHIPFHLGRVLGGLRHLELQTHPDVYEALRSWLA